MNTRKKGPSYLWGLVATAAAMCALGQVAQAGSIGLMATQNQLPGDPPWRYTINVALLPDATIASGTSITVGGLVGVDVTSGMTLPPGNDSAGNPTVVWFVPNNGVTTTGYTVDANGNTAPISTFTWEYIGPTLTYSDSNPALNNLGNFTVQTNAGLTFNMVTPPVPSGTPVPTSVTVYTTPDGTPTTTTDTVPVVTVDAVPEPSSLSMLLIGGGAVALLFRVRSRARSHVP